MTSSLTRLTKAELIARLQAAEQRPATTWADAWNLVRDTSLTAIRELRLLCEDLYAAGAWCRRHGTMAVVEIKGMKLFKA